MDVPKEYTTWQWHIIIVSLTTNGVGCTTKPSRGDTDSLHNEGYLNGMH